MRSLLDRFYDACGYLAAASMAGIGVCVLAQIVWRVRGLTLDATEASGFCLAAATFLGLAHTLRHRAHVRINLLTTRLPAGLRKATDLVNTLLATGVTACLAWYLGRLALQSYEFHDVSPGLLAMPMWIPQSSAALGVTALALAFLDELVWLLGGGASRQEPAAEVDLDEPPVA